MNSSVQESWKKHTFQKLNSIRPATSIQYRLVTDTDRRADTDDGEVRAVAYSVARAMTSIRRVSRTRVGFRVAIWRIRLTIPTAVHWTRRQRDRHQSSALRFAIKKISQQVSDKSRSLRALYNNLLFGFVRWLMSSNSVGITTLNSLGLQSFVFSLPRMCS